MESAVRWPSEAPQRVAKFYIPSDSNTWATRQRRKEHLLGISAHKLHEIRHAQRGVGRPPDLRKTVLIYNMFKSVSTEPLAAECGEMTPVPELVSVGSGADGMSGMDVDAEEAEQFWFDQCIDRVLSDDDDDDDDDDVDVDVRDEGIFGACGCGGNTPGMRSDERICVGCGVRSQESQQVEWQKHDAKGSQLVGLAGPHRSDCPAGTPWMGYLHQ